ncbi:MAG: signal peptidase I [Clostridia bacterium]|nr:signal peptidase I [Clostridia bacterium]
MDSKKANKSKAKKALSVIGNILIWIFIAFAVVITILAFSATSSKDGIPSVGGRVISPVLTDSMSPTFDAGDMILSRKLTDDEKTGLKVYDIITFKTDLNGDGAAEVNTHRIIEVIGEGSSIQYKTKGDNEILTDPYTINPVDVISVVNSDWSFVALDDNGKASLSVKNVIKCRIDADGDGEADDSIQLIKEVVKEGGKVVAYKTKSISMANNTEYTVEVAAVTEKLAEKVTRIPGLGAFINFLMSPTGFFIVIVIPLILFFLYEIVMFILKIVQVRGGGKKKISAEDEELIRQRAIEEYIRSQQQANNTPPAGAAPPAQPAETKPEPKAEPAPEAKPEPKAEEAKVEEPKAEEPKAEEPKAEETPAEEPKAEEAKVEEAPAEEAKAEEPKAEEPKAEEAPAEEPKAEEPKAEEAPAEEAKAEEAEPAAEETPAEEPKAEETPAEEAKTEEVKPEA